jgi:hypothetical protein
MLEAIETPWGYVKIHGFLRIRGQAPDCARDLLYPIIDSPGAYLFHRCDP